MKRLYLSALGTKNISDWSSYIFFHKSIDIFAQAIFNIRIKEQSDRIWSTTLQKKNFAGCRILAWSTVRQEIALLSPVFERITCITSTYGSPFIMASFLFHVKISNLLQFLTSKYGRLCNANTWICPWVFVNLRVHWLNLVVLFPFVFICIYFRSVIFQT